MPWDFWLIFLLLGVVVPWRGRQRLRELLAKPSVGPAERISLYVTTIAFQWFAAGVAAWRAWAHGLSSNQLGLVTHSAGSVGAAAVLGAAILAALQWMNLRRMSRMPEKMRAPMQALAERILPQSTKERVPFFALAVTAGICEEFLYRGFAMAAFTRAGMPGWSVVVLSSILFGLAHLYQGRGGLVGTMLLGLLFGTARITLGSLVPIMGWHAAVDVVAGVAGPRYLIHNKVVVDNAKNSKF
ncbi:MAG: CPBP family intramembrane glutamic endopeptidase [Candidatus Acidiferrum sp.]|jgi:CAAX protease family protein